MNNFVVVVVAVCFGVTKMTTDEFETNLPQHQHHFHYHNYAGTSQFFPVYHLVWIGFTFFFMILIIVAIVYCPRDQGGRNNNANNLQRAIESAQKD